MAALLATAALLVTLFHLAPGDALASIPDGEALRPVLAPRWHLDEPLGARILGTWSSVLGGDFGTSWVIRPGAPVTEMAGGPGLATAARVLAALALSTALGFLRSRTLALLSLAPVFAAAHAAVFSLNAAVAWGLDRGLWGRPAWFALPVEPTWEREALAVLLLAVASGTLATWARELEAERARLSEAPFLRTLTGDGAVTTRAMLPHLVVPTLAHAAARLPALVGGAVVVEQALLLPGAGSLFWQAAEARDHELACALALAAATAVILLRWAVDALAMSWDPRRRVEAT